MAFLETPRFPEIVSNNAGWQGGPGYETDIVEVDSGREQRNAVWDYPRHEYDARHAIRESERFRPFRDFFHIAQGSANGFRVKDWFDYTATDGVGRFLMIDATHFQMVKRYTVGASTKDRLISKPVSGSIVLVGGTPLSTDYTTGIVTMTSGTPTFWSGEFDVPCRFGIDKMRGLIVSGLADGDLLMDWDAIPIIEIRI